MVAVAIAGIGASHAASGRQQRAPGIDDLEPDRITAIEGSAMRANTDREVDAAPTRSGDAGPTLRGCVWRRSG